jgi:hypothetical protein
MQTSPHAAAIFTAASGATNLAYGWQKGDTLATCLVWSGVAGAVAIVFPLSWPTLIRSVDARRWSAALISLVALFLAVTYSTALMIEAGGGLLLCLGMALSGRPADSADVWCQS